MLSMDAVRSHFPALASGAIFFDNPGGTQVVQEALQRLQHYILHSNANHGGVFRTTLATEEIVDGTRQAVADFLNAEQAEEIVFGPNMTTLTLLISRSLAHRLQPGDEIVVTRLDHDANVTPWRLIAEERGCTVRMVDFRVEDCTLDMAAMEQQITERTKIVAVGYASNAVGTINDVRRVVQMAHAVGALCFIDAVQYAPHRTIDVQELDCDFLACSVYKFFGPHLGVLYGKYELLDSLKSYQVRPAIQKPPYKFETGTKSFEALAGTLGVMEYFTWLGESAGSEFAPTYCERYSGRRLLLKQGMAAIEAYELGLNEALLARLSSLANARVLGITDPQRMHERVPTFSITVPRYTPRELAAMLNKADIYTWDGNFYALELSEYLGLEEQGGMLRIGLVHYNTVDEVERLIAALEAGIR
ncbi:MAG: cysteine desulfurase-like protein [Ktedonobacteraceae bacterium]|nr:cysteine desulfurase-like protein [Ktedonobacteraceae bacterium]